GMEPRDRRPAGGGGLHRGDDRPLLPGRVQKTVQSVRKHPLDMLHIVRALFVGICAVLGGAIGDQVYKHPMGGLVAGLGSGLAFVGLELVFTRRVASVLSTLMIGLLVGCLVSYFMNMTLDLVLKETEPVLKSYRNISITVVLSFMSILIILHLKDDFKFVIPFVELKRESGGSKPAILDTSAIIDGRIADV